MPALIVREVKIHPDILVVRVRKGDAGVQGTVLFGINASGADRSLPGNRGFTDENSIGVAIAPDRCCGGWGRSRSEMDFGLNDAQRWRGIDIEDAELHDSKRASQSVRFESTQRKCLDYIQARCISVNSAGYIIGRGVDRGNRAGGRIHALDHVVVRKVKICAVAPNPGYRSN